MSGGTINIPGPVRADGSCETVSWSLGAALEDVPEGTKREMARLLHAKVRAEEEWNRRHRDLMKAVNIEMNRRLTLRERLLGRKRL